MIGTNTYPGRGIICGKDADDVRFCAYFLTARSPSSRNRRLAYREDQVLTEVVDPSQVIDPALLIYTAMQEVDQRLVVTNGDHSQMIVEGIANDLSFAASLKNATYEPDEPHFTPRISALVEDDQYTLSIIRRRGTLNERSFYPYRFDEKGMARIIHTYEGEREPLPSFIGEPRALEIKVAAKEVGSWLWKKLEGSNRLAVALWILDGPKRQVMIINEGEGEGRWNG